MLLSLTIRDLVLIERLELSFGPGLSVLTGETGAGKSILLDGLGLALGARGESGLVRPGAAQAVVAAEFQLDPADPVHQLLADQGVESGETLILRRVIGADGRSRGFVNDQPTSVGLLRLVGDRLVEIQGQFEQRGLLDPASHRELVDAYAGASALAAEVRAAWDEWQRAGEARTAVESALARAKADEEWLRHTLAELDTADLEPGEEARLAEERTLLQHRAQLAEALAEAAEQVGGARGALPALNAAARALERVRPKAAGRLDPAIEAIERAIVEANEAQSLLEALMRQAGSADDLERIEGRLFDLRALARKHARSVDDLIPYREAIARQLAALEDQGLGVRDAVAAEQQARARFLASAAQLTETRTEAVRRLDREVMAELEPLRLGRARFATALRRLDESDWGPNGAERVTFEVATNPGSPPGSLSKIASGGELARFLLAIKVVLARVSSVPTIVFDEVDAGIGGAVAAAVGERLQRLGSELQVLVVTHSPQVAARGEHHLRVVKDSAAERALTRVEPLGARERREEIARMLSGARITDEARAAADILLTASAA